MHNNSRHFPVHVTLVGNPIKQSTLQKKYKNTVRQQAKKIKLIKTFTVIFARIKMHIDWLINCKHISLLSKRDGHFNERERKDVKLFPGVRQNKSSKK